MVLQDAPLPNNVLSKIHQTTCKTFLGETVPLGGASRKDCIYKQRVGQIAHLLAVLRQFAYSLHQYDCDYKQYVCELVSFRYLVAARKLTLANGTQHGCNTIGSSTAAI